MVQIVLFGLFVFLVVASGNAAVQPNIILIVADDMGWNDVGFHGSNQIPTPNIDALAYNGIILNSHYVLPICTPSRASLMTGKYAIHTGMQGYPLATMEPRSLPEGKLMPEYLKDLGYSTTLIGKWHLGHSRFNETPTERGFDTHIGYYSGFISYYDFIKQEAVNGTMYNGFDMRRNKEPAWADAGQYATDFFTNEAIKTIQKHPKEQPLFLMVSHLAAHTGNLGKLLEAPQEEINKLGHIIDAGRRTYAAMVTKMDESIGKIVLELRKNQMLDNSIIVFMSDNGAPTIGEFPNQGSNYPLRGVKETLWEGGVRGAAFIWSPLLQETPRVSTDLMHITDWLPTLYTAAGGDVNILDPEMDGIDQWSSLVYNLPTARAEVLLNIDEKYRNAALRYNNWKIILGSVPNHSEFNRYYGDSGKVNIRKTRYNTSAISQSVAAKAIKGLGAIATQESEYGDLRKQATVLCLTDNENKMDTACNPEGGLCLYDISSDPCEEHDLAKLFPQIVKRMKRLLVEYRSRLVLQRNVPADLRADPKNFNYTWSPWLEGVTDPIIRNFGNPDITTTLCTLDKCDI